MSFVLTLWWVKKYETPQMWCSRVQSHQVNTRLTDGGHGGIRRSLKNAAATFNIQNELSPDLFIISIIQVSTYAAVLHPALHYTGVLTWRRAGRGLKFGWMDQCGQIAGLASVAAQMFEFLYFIIHQQKLKSCLQRLHQCWHESCSSSFTVANIVTYSSSEFSAG